MSPSVSIVMPCFNHGRFLREAVASALGQTFQDFEIVLVDDGSDDAETIELLERAEWPKTRIVRGEHRGVTHARNSGIRESKGRYLSFFDSDDRMHPQFLERLSSVLENDSSLAFASCWVQLFGDESWAWKPVDAGFPGLLHECTIATAALVRSSVVNEVGGFDGAFELGHEDWDLWLRIVERGHRGTIVPEILFSYRRALDSRSSVADRHATYVELYRDRIRKYRELYRRHLFDVLWLKERGEIGPAFEALLSAQAELSSNLEANVAALQREIR